MLSKSSEEDVLGQQQLHEALSTQTALGPRRVLVQRPLKLTPIAQTTRKRVVRRRLHLLQRALGRQNWQQR